MLIHLRLYAFQPEPVFATGTPVFENRCWSSAEPYYGQSESWMHRLRDKGHDVVSIGKQHYRSAADDCGFSEQYLPMYLTNDGKGWPQALMRKPLGVFSGTKELVENIGPGETSYTNYDRDITNRAKMWLDKQAANQSEIPWVLFVSFICPHYPLVSPLEFYKLYENVDLPVAFDTMLTSNSKHTVMDRMRQFWDYNDYFDEETQREGLKNYYGLCSFVDDNVGQVIKTLDDSGMRSDTQIIYTSDHGDLIGNHGIWCKSFMYEDSVGIPMILNGDGIDPGENNTPVSLVDMAATIEAFVSDGSKQCHDGFEVESDSYSKPIQNFVGQENRGRCVISEYHDGGSPCAIFMLREGPWKLIYYTENNPPILFNLEEDPQELNNLVDNPECLEQLTTLKQKLFDITDPEEVNRQAFADQSILIDKLGGADVINGMKTFNHTPLE